jgi:type II secretory pathway pseudopilin PulG
MTGVSLSSHTGRSRRGFTYLELIASVMLVALASLGAVLSWRLAPQAVANKRVTELSVQLAVSELERLRAYGYEGLTETPVTAPNVFYFDKSGVALGSSTGASYKVKSWVITLDSNGDNAKTSADLRELTVEVWNPGETRRYERAQTLLTSGGV